MRFDTTARLRAEIQHIQNNLKAAIFSFAVLTIISSSPTIRTLSTLFILCALGVYADTVRIENSLVEPVDGSPQAPSLAR